MISGKDEAERAFHRVGLTFALYGEDEGTERLIPFDIVPRIIPGDEWEMLEGGLLSRVAALNAFRADIYGTQRILDRRMDRRISRDAGAA